MHIQQRRSHADSVKCPYCQALIRMGEETVVCSCCKMPHHLECWIENGQCTTYGCRGHRLVNPPFLPHRRQMLPTIEISFDEPPQSHRWSKLGNHRWKVAVLLAAVLGGGIYFMTFL